MEKVGFVGLGLMGAAMAENLLRAGHQLCVFNRTPSKAAPLVEAGAKLARNPADLAHQVGDGCIIVCVTDTPAMQTAIGGEHGLIHGLSRGALVIDMGTSTVEASRDIAAKLAALNAGFIDAPVSGGEIGAKEGNLSIMAGGSASDITRAQPLFDILGKTTVHIGAIGTGQAAKAANQIIVGAPQNIVAEALMLAEAAGADKAKVREALLGGFAGSRILDLHGQRMIDRQFAPGGRATTQNKDMRQAVELSDQLSLNLPLLNKTAQLWQEMENAGLGDLDQSGCYAFLEKLQK